MQRALVLLFFLLSAAPAWAQGSRTPELTPMARVSLITVYPGDTIEAQFGHSAIRVRDPGWGIDWVYNYGTFDWEDPTFLARFIAGQLDYRLGTADYGPMVPFYQRLGRPIVEQRLALTGEERQALFAFLERNALPEHREYRYKFLVDNCATRIRDVFELVLGDRLDWGEPAAAGLSYREVLMPHFGAEPWVRLGVDLALGADADQVMTGREAMFLPVPMAEAFAGARVERDGEFEPLVTRTRKVYWPANAGTVEPWRIWPGVAGWGLLVGGLVLTGTSVRRRRRGSGETSADWGMWGRRADALLLGVVGVVGLVMAGLWALTEHDVTGPNWNLLWAWPTHLLAALAVWRGWWPGAVRWYLVATGVGCLVTLAGWWAWPQALPAPVVPLILLIGARVALRARGS
ncbi:MAG: DUF4105 domain-containing protein [Phycisphaeraceae bacterium]